MAWKSSENARQIHGKAAVHRKTRGQEKAGKKKKKKWLNNVENELRYTGVRSQRLKVSVMEEWVAIVTEPKVLHGQ